MEELDAANSKLAERIGGVPDLEPLAELVNARAWRHPPTAASLRALGEGGWWTETGLFDIGKVGDSTCRASYLAKRTMHHRFVGCEARREARDA